MPKLLITGANGFVGQHLIQLLKDNYSVLGLIHKSDLKDTQNITYKSGNILDLGFLQDLIKNFQPDSIIHLAAISTPWAQDPENIFKINLIGTLNIYQAINNLRKGSGAYNPKIIYVSSAEVYGKTKNPENIKENDPFYPANYYGTSKAAADRLSYQMSQSAKLNIVIIRPFNHTGPGQLKGFFVPDIASQIVEIENGHSKSELMVGNLDSVRDLTDVRDIVEGYKKVLEKDIEPGVAFNLCSGNGIKMQDLLEKLLSFAKKEIKVVHDPKRLRPSEVPITVGDNSKFRKQFDWQPKIPIDQTLKDTLEYWRIEANK